MINGKKKRARKHEVNLEFGKMKKKFSQINAMPAHCNPHLKLITV